MSLHATDPTCRGGLTMFVDRGIPEGAATRSKWRDWPGCMVRPRIARGFRRSGGKRSCINVSSL